MPAWFVRSTLCLGLATAAYAQERRPLADPNAIPEESVWQERDAEGRWALMRAADLSDPTRQKIWIDALSQRGDAELLEWVVWSEDTGWLLASDALVASDDPRWIRAAVLGLDSGDSHNMEGTSKDLRKHGDVFLGWLARFPSERHGIAASLAEELEEQGVTAKDASRYLGPASLGELYGALSKALEEEPVEFGERTHAQPDQLYVQTVERAIRTAQARALPPARARRDLERLTRSKHLSLATQAALAFTYFPGEHVPTRELIGISRSERPIQLREAALLAASYGPSREWYAELHWALAKQDHPLRHVALSRLREVGDAFTLTLLAAEGSEPEATLAGALAGNAKPTIDLKWTKRALDLLAETAAKKHPITPRLEAWTRGLLKPAVRESEEIRTYLQRLVDDQPSDGPELSARGVLVRRGLSERLLDAWKADLERAK